MSLDEHTPKNVNLVHRLEQKSASFNMRLAVGITKGMGSMTCAYIFIILALIGFPGLHATPTQYVQWISQTFIQLVALSVLAVGQSIIGRHQELLADEQYKTTVKTYGDTEDIKAHLQNIDEQLTTLAVLIKASSEPKPREAKKPVVRAAKTEQGSV